LEGKIVNQRSSFLITGFFGIGLAMVVTVLTGWLAALPIPSAVLHNFNHHSIFLFIFTSVVFINLPVMMFSFAAGWVLFRSLGRATPAPALLCSVPWVLYCGYDIIHALVGTAASTGLGLVFSVFTWSSIFTVPAGLLLASLIRVSGLSSNRIHRGPGGRPR
jgi:hypothetical protein